MGKDREILIREWRCKNGCIVGSHSCTPSLSSFRLRWDHLPPYQEYLYMPASPAAHYTRSPNYSTAISFLLTAWLRIPESKTRWHVGGWTARRCGRRCGVPIGYATRQRTAVRQAGSIEQSITLPARGTSGPDERASPPR
jgi:hypothetical protein